MTDIKRLADLDAETNALCGQVSHDEARAILSRFVNSHFKNPGEHARASIPADPKRDDDLRLAAYIAQRRDRERDLLAAALLLAKEVRARRLLDDTPELDVDTKFGSPEQIRWSLASNAFLAARAAVESNPLANAMIEEARAATDAKNKEQAMIDDILSLPHAAIAERVWQGTSWSYPNIERLIVELTSLRARVAELEAACRTVLLALDRAPIRVDHKLTDLLAALTDAKNKEGGSSIREECQRIIEDLAIVADAPCINATRRSVLTGSANMLERLSAAAEAISVVEAFSDAKNKDQP